MPALPPRLAAFAVLLLAAGVSSARVFSPSITATDEMAVVYLYRPAAQSPGLAKPLRRAYPEVLVDDKPVGTVPYNHYLAFHLHPGSHVIRVTGLTAGAKKWELRDVTQEVSAGAGETLYFRLKVEFNQAEMNIGQPRPSYLYWFGPMDAEDAQYQIRDTSEAR